VRERERERERKRVVTSAVNGTKIYIEKKPRGENLRKCGNSYRKRYVKN